MARGFDVPSTLLAVAVRAAAQTPDDVSDQSADVQRSGLLEIVRALTAARLSIASDVEDRFDQPAAVDGLRHMPLKAGGKGGRAV